MNSRTYRRGLAERDVDLLAGEQAAATGDAVGSQDVLRRGAVVARNGFDCFAGRDQVVLAAGGGRSNRRFAGGWGVRAAAMDRQDAIGVAGAMRASPVPSAAIPAQLDLGGNARRASKAIRAPTVTLRCCATARPRSPSPPVMT